MTDLIRKLSFSVFCFYVVTRVTAFILFTSRLETEVEEQISSEPRTVAREMIELQHGEHGLALTLHHLEGYIQRTVQANKGMYEHVRNHWRLV